MIEESKIIITKDENNEWNIDIHNVNVMYLPELLGNVLQDAFESEAFNPLEPTDVLKQKKMSLGTIANKLGIIDYVSPQVTWISLEDKKPTHSGPFICIEESFPDKVYSNMYWDNENQMFGTKSGDGYAFITHWQEVPRF